jgi:hypothetical protein
MITRTPLGVRTGTQGAEWVAADLPQRGYWEARQIMSATLHATNIAATGERLRRALID